MKKNFLKLLVWTFLLINLSTAGFAQPTGEFEPKFSIGINLLETAAFTLVRSAIGATEVTFIPVHMDANYIINKKWGLGFGLVYRYENYDEPIVNKFGTGNVGELWTRLHELFLMVGPRYSFSNTGHKGFYASLKAGVGGLLSAGGYALTAVAEPELGYSLLFGNKFAFHLDFALGMLFNIPIIERPYLGYSGLSTIGWLVHRTIPIARIGVGFAF